MPRTVDVGIMITGRDNASPALKTTRESVVSLTAKLTALRAAAGVVTRFITGSVQAFLKQEEAVIAVNQALRATNQLTPQTSKQVLDIANAMQELTSVGDETVLMLQKQLLALGTNTSQLRDATRIAIGMSKALGVDLNSAVRAVGKGLQGSTDSFREYGIVIDKDRDLLEQLDERFGEFAKSTGSVADRMQRLSGLFGDFREKIVAAPFVKIAGSFGDLELALVGINKALETGGFDQFLRAAIFGAEAVEASLTPMQRFEEQLRGQVTTLQEQLAATKQAEVGFSRFVDSVVLGGTAFADLESKEKRLLELETELATKRNTLNQLTLNAGAAMLAASRAATTQAEAQRKAAEAIEKQAAATEKLVERQKKAQEFAKKVAAESKALATEGLRDIERLIIEEERLRTEARERAAQENAVADAAQRELILSQQQFEAEAALKRSEAEEAQVRQSIERQERLRDIAVSAATTIGTAFIQTGFAMAEGSKTGGEAVRDMSKLILKTMLDTAVKTIIAQAIVGEAGILASTGPLGPAALIVGPLLAATFGALISGFLNQLPTAQRGLLVRGGVPGIDSVPVLAQRGELVVDRQTTDALMQLLRQTADAGTTQGVAGGPTIVFNQLVPQSPAEARRFVRDNIQPHLTAMQMRG